jgi:uncharacterized protein YwgA
MKDFEKAADIIRDAGGRIVGRTRLQKIAYLLEATGLGSGFEFEYRHYGPYSEQLADAVSTSRRLSMITEENHPTNWGGFYSIFTTTGDSGTPEMPGRRELIEETKNADPVALELAATAAFLALDGEDDAWGETANRKPEKAKLKMDEAKSLYSRLRKIAVPIPIPDIQ